MRWSSGTCMKRFSNTRSVTTEAPCATHSTAISCACMSVGKPGNGAVVTWSGWGGPVMRRCTLLESETISAPHSLSLSSVACMSAGSTPTRRTSPPAITTAASSVPASMRSPATRCRTPRSMRTPSITIRSLPAPWISAPIFWSTCASSATSGSRAAFSITVSPSARQAAIITFCVPFTVLRSNVMRPRVRRAAVAST